MSVNSAILMPIGSVICHASSSAPDGWLVCNGGSYLRSEYQALFNAIDVTYGSVDDSHFNVPDLSNRGPIGVGNAGGGSVGLCIINGNGTPGSIDNTSNEINCQTTQALNIYSSGDHRNYILKYVNYISIYQTLNVTLIALCTVCAERSLATFGCKFRSTSGCLPFGLH